MDSIREKVEALLETPCRVIDILPEKVPAGAPGRYFAVERFYLEPSRYAGVRRRFADVVVKLYCYYDFSVLLGDADAPLIDPEPEQLAAWIESAKEHICMLVGEDALLVIGTDDLYITVFHADEPLTRRLELLAEANGLFLR